MRVGLVLLAVMLCGCGKKADPARVEPAVQTTWPEEGLIAMGADHACAVAPSGEVRCFGGTNLFGQGGLDGTLASDHGVPAKGLDAHPVRLVAGSHDTCALYADGRIECLGTKRLVPGRKGTSDPGDPYVDLSVNSDDLCAVRRSGKILCWNADIDFVVIDGVPPADTISLGHRLGCAHTRDHEAYCFAWPPPGKPEKIAAHVSAVVTSGFAMCVVGDDRKLSCRGDTDRGILGATRKTEQLVPIADDVEDLTLADHACFLRAGAPYCWGWNAYGQVGDGTRDNQMAPTKVETPDVFVSLVANGMRTCGRTTKGALVCWGLRRSDDIVGDPSVARFAPLTISGL